jgi:3-deoxy-alpha-D-manno-octulosonate 8-oxidase
MLNVTKTVGTYHFGSGAIEQISDFIPRGGDQATGFAVFLIDHFFRGNALVERLPIEDRDMVIFVDTTDEPKTEGIDKYVETIFAAEQGVPHTVIGIGGGASLDTGKAVANLLTNGGKAEDYQGWDLVREPGVFKIGIPTISGTGAEASRTCVMLNVAKNLKLGMNSEHTVYDRLVLDPDLTATVPRQQYFYTGMDTFIHCIESLGGNYRHSVADAYSREALNLASEVFTAEDMQSDENRKKIMVASFLGGSAIGNSFVGIVHPFSAGLSVAFGTHHCEANCVVMNVMEAFYPRETEQFQKMLERQGLAIERGYCGNLSEEKCQQLYEATVVHEVPLRNALGDEFKSILTKDKVIEIFQGM